MSDSQKNDLPVHVGDAIYEVADAAANPSGYADDADEANRRADLRDRLVVKLTEAVTDMSKSLSESLPEGLYAEVNSEGMVIRDCQDWAWVICPNTYENDPPEWRAEVRRRVLTAFGLPHSASMSESS